jgi:multiple antibiotic resistance protein
MKAVTLSKSKTMVGLFAAGILLLGTIPVLGQVPVPAVAFASFADSFSFGHMFTFLFLMLGPIKILGPFVKLTRNADAAFTRRFAIRGALLACVSLLIASAIGEHFLVQYQIRVSVLAIAAGIILFLVALRTVLEQFDSPAETVATHLEPDMRYAVSPLAFPTIVTPYGVAALIVCLALTPTHFVRMEIYGALVGLMVVNLIAMLFAKPILKYLGLPLMLLGTVLGVIQVALGLAIIVAGLRGLGLAVGA